MASGKQKYNEIGQRICLGDISLISPRTQPRVACVRDCSLQTSMDTCEAGTNERCNWNGSTCKSQSWRIDTCGPDGSETSEPEDCKWKLNGECPRTVDHPCHHDNPCDELDNPFEGPHDQDQEIFNMCRASLLNYCETTQDPSCYEVPEVMKVLEPMPWIYGCPFAEDAFPCTDHPDCWGNSYGLNITVECVRSVQQHCSSSADPGCSDPAIVEVTAYDSASCSVDSPSAFVGMCRMDWDMPGAFACEDFNGDFETCEGMPGCRADHATPTCRTVDPYAEDCSSYQGQPQACGALPHCMVAGDAEESCINLCSDVALMSENPSEATERCEKYAGICEMQIDQFFQCMTHCESMSSSLFSNGHAAACIANAHCVWMGCGEDCSVLDEPMCQEHSEECFWEFNDAQCYSHGPVERSGCMFEDRFSDGSTCNHPACDVYMDATMAANPDSAPSLNAECRDAIGIYCDTAADPACESPLLRSSLAFAEGMCDEGHVFIGRCEQGDIGAAMCEQEVSAEDCDSRVACRWEDDPQMQMCGPDFSLPDCRAASFDECGTAGGAFSHCQDYGGQCDYPYCSFYFDDGLMEEVCSPGCVRKGSCVKDFQCNALSGSAVSYPDLHCIDEPNCDWIGCVPRCDTAQSEGDCMGMGHMGCWWEWDQQLCLADCGRPDEHEWCDGEDMMPGSCVFSLENDANPCFSDQCQGSGPISRDCFDVVVAFCEDPAATDPFCGSPMYGQLTAFRADGSCGPGMVYEGICRGSGSCFGADNEMECVVGGCDWIETSFCQSRDSECWMYDDMQDPAGCEADPLCYSHADGCDSDPRCYDLLDGATCDGRDECRWDEFGMSCNYRQCHELMMEDCQGLVRCQWNEEDEYCREINCDFLSEGDCGLAEICQYEVTGHCERQCYGYEQFDCRDLMEDGCEWSGCVETCESSGAGPGECDVIPGCQWREYTQECVPSCERADADPVECGGCPFDRSAISPCYFEECSNGVTNACIDASEAYCASFPDEGGYTDAGCLSIEKQLLAAREQADCPAGFVYAGACMDRSYTGFGEDDCYRMSGNQTACLESGCTYGKDFCFRECRRLSLDRDMCEMVDGCQFVACLEADCATLPPLECDERQADGCYVNYDGFSACVPAVGHPDNCECPFSFPTWDSACPFGADHPCRYDSPCVLDRDLSDASQGFPASWDCINHAIDYCSSSGDQGCAEAWDLISASVRLRFAPAECPFDDATCDSLVECEDGPFIQSCIDAVRAVCSTDEPGCELSAVRRLIASDRGECPEGEVFVGRCGGFFAGDQCEGLADDEAACTANGCTYLPSRDYRCQPIPPMEMLMVPHNWESCWDFEDWGNQACSPDAPDHCYWANGCRSVCSTHDVYGDDLVAELICEQFSDVCFFGPQSPPNCFAECEQYSAIEVFAGSEELCRGLGCYWQACAPASCEVLSAFECRIERAYSGQCYYDDAEFACKYNQEFLGGGEPGQPSDDPGPEERGCSFDLVAAESPCAQDVCMPPVDESGCRSYVREYCNTIGSSDAGKPEPVYSRDRFF